MKYKNNLKGKKSAMTIYWLMPENRFKPVSLSGAGEQFTTGPFRVTQKRRRKKVFSYVTAVSPAGPDPENLKVSLFCNSTLHQQGNNDINS